MKEKLESSPQNSDASGIPVLNAGETTFPFDNISREKKIKTVWILTSLYANLCYRW